MATNDITNSEMKISSVIQRFCRLKKMGQNINKYRDIDNRIEIY